jgi:hypothetical protein
MRLHILALYRAECQLTQFIGPIGNESIATSQSIGGNAHSSAAPVASLDMAQGDRAPQGNL